MSTFKAKSSSSLLPQIAVVKLGGNKRRYAGSCAQQISMPSRLVSLSKQILGSRHLNTSFIRYGRLDRPSFSVEKSAHK